MNCPYCSKEVYGLTGLQEVLKFRTHLGKCRKNPNNLIFTNGSKTVVTPKYGNQDLMSALKIRAESGQ